MVTSAFVDGHGGDGDVAGEGGFFLKVKFAGAGEIAGDLAVDDGVLAVDGVRELDLGAFFDDEAFAAHLAHDFSVAADDEVSGAIDPAGKLAEHGEVVAADGNAGDGGLFLDGDVSARLDAAVPVIADVVVLEPDVGTAGWTEGGAGLGGCLVFAIAFEALDISGGHLALEEAGVGSGFFDEFRGRGHGALASYGSGVVHLSFVFCWWRECSGWRIADAVPSSGGWGGVGGCFFVGYGYAVDNLVVGAASTAVGGYGYTWLGLLEAAVGAYQADLVFARFPLVVRRVGPVLF